MFLLRCLLYKPYAGKMRLFTVKPSDACSRKNWTSED